MSAPGGQKIPSDAPRRLLDALREEGVLPVGVADYLDVERLLRSRDSWERLRLKRSLVALLARSEDEARGVAAAFDRAFGPDAPGAGGGMEDAAAPRPGGREDPPDGAGPMPDAEPTARRADGPLLLPQPPQRGLRGRLLRLQAGLASLRPFASWLLPLGFATGLTAALVGRLYTAQVHIDAVDEARPAGRLVDAPPSEGERIWRRADAPLQPEARADLPLPSPRHGEPWWYWGLLAVGFTLPLWLVGRSVALTALAWPEREARRREAQLDAARAARLTQARDLADAGLGYSLRYHVPRRTLVPAEAVRDSATWLGRLRRDSRGTALDEEATVSATVGRAGRFSPRYQDRHQREPLVVLVDEERGDHPWLTGILQIVEGWRAQGIPLVEGVFSHDPSQLRLKEQPGSLSFDAFERRYGGLPLLIFSRRLNPRGLKDEAPWARALGRWDRLAWIDPDPTPPEDRGADAGRVQALADLKIPRFSLCHKGLVAAARQVLGEDAPPPPKGDALPSLEDGGVDRALKAWATAAALVPDASWDQLEALRRAFPKEIGGTLTSPRDVALLTQWVAREGGIPLAEAEGPGGRSLNIPPALRRRLKDAQARDDAATPGEGFGLRAHRYLAEQLRQAGRPDHPMLAALFDRKLASHLLFLDVEAWRALIDALRESAVGEEVLEDLEEELAVQQAAPTVGPRALAALAAEVEPGASVPVGALLLPARPGFGRRAMLDMLAPLALVGAGAWLMEASFLGAWLLTPKSEVRAALIPPIWGLEASVRRVFPETPSRPKMVEVPAGTYTIGSLADEEGHGAGEELREVTLTRPYAIFVTETTQGQYLERMGNNPAYFVNDPRRPVERVSWVDACRFANALSVSEGLPRCYVIKGDEIRGEEGRFCQGYRLPRPDEWEVAARAGGRTPWAGSWTPGEVAWTEENSDGVTHPVASLAPNAWGLYDMSGNAMEWGGNEEIPQDPDHLGDFRDPNVTPRPGPYMAREIYKLGGSYAELPVQARVSRRVLVEELPESGGVGFRLVRTLPPAAAAAKESTSVPTVGTGDPAAAKRAALRRAADASSGDQ